MNLILRAAQFAAQAHAGQFRKDGVTPYIVHPMRVAGRIMMRTDATEEMAAAAWLHDTLEDTKTTPLQIETIFGAAILKLVMSVTNVSTGLKLPRAERKKMDAEFVSKAPREAQIIKLVDRIDNLRDMAQDDFFRLYARESFQLVELIGHADPVLTQELERLIG